MRPKYTPKSLICKHGFYKCCMHRKYHWRSIPPMSIYIVSWLKSSVEMNPTNVGIEVLWFGRIALAFPVNKTKFDVISWRFSSSFFFVCNQDCVIFSRIHVPSSILINKYICLCTNIYADRERYIHLMKYHHHKIKQFQTSFCVASILLFVLKLKWMRWAFGQEYNYH